MSHDPLRHVIVGAGISGLLTARGFQEQGILYVVYEKSGVIGGLWNSENEEYCLANSDSTIQTDPISHGLPEEAAEVINHDDPFVNYHQTPAQLMERFKQYADALTTPIVFHREVVSFQMADEGRQVIVTSHDVVSGKVHVETFAGLHLRQGSLTKRLAQTPKYPGESLFEGRVGFPFAENVTLAEMKDRHVVVVGSGAFAIDTARRALKAEATSVTILFRRPHVHSFDYASYLYLSGVQNVQAMNPDHIAAVFAETLAANRRLCEATGTVDAFMSPEVVRDVGGAEHLIHRNGIWSTSVDAVALGMHYGLAAIHVDTVDRLEPRAVVCASGRRIQCDVIIKACGWESEAAQTILKGHTIKDGLWVDGWANVTSNCGLDKVRSVIVHGPNSPGRSILIPSYYFFYTFAIMIARFLLNPALFQDFTRFPVSSAVTSAEVPQFTDGLDLLTKIFAFQNPDLLGLFVGVFAAKTEAFRQYLDRQKFLRLDREKWDELTALFSCRTGKPQLPYPFAGPIE